ncbi:MAG TPA: alpha-L-fucosidase [Capsulimonadaceae bacterium]|jgi:alpha-L-fucosidase
MTTQHNTTYLAGPFDHSWDSLRSFECPTWFRDAKLAFWSHWGPQSVPMYGDWYARHMYVEGHEQYLHHWRTYGHPSKVGYKDLVQLWKAERFDPEGLMDLFVDAGAKYFVGQAMHHDNFDNFDSAHQPWNSVKVGPKKDICRLWQQAAHARGLPFGLTEHLGASFAWWQCNKCADENGPYAGTKYDGANPAYESLYYPSFGPAATGDDRAKIDPWYTENEWFHRHWFDRIKDVIDKFQPDLLYSDGGLPFGEYGRRIVAHLYNTSASVHGANRAVYNQKDKNPDIYTIGVLDIERSQLTEIAQHPWQTDTSVGDWFYNVKDVYKTPRQVLETLVDIVSNNGNLVMNITQKPDGTLDDECTYLLKQLAVWMKSGNGEGVFGSRPWTHSTEGPSKFTQKSHFDESAVSWTPDDYRFTRNGETVYAYQMTPSPDGTGIIRSLASTKSRRVSSVRSLEHGPVEFVQTFTGLNFKLPAPPTIDAPIGLAINIE